MRIICKEATPLFQVPDFIAPWVDELLPGMSAVVLNDVGDYYFVETDYRYQGYVQVPRVTVMEEDSLRANICSVAQSYLGVPYRWGGKSRTGLDCSGLCFMAYYLNGITIFRDAKLAEGFPIHEIDAQMRKPGDLLYFPRHVALYLGNERYIHANRTDGCVAYGSLSPEASDYRSDLTDFRCGSYF